MTTFIDRTGQIYGHLTVIKEAPRNSERVRWLCRCDCGQGIEVDGNRLHRKQDCGCVPHSSLVDFTARRFGRLIAINREPNQNGRTMWLCSCDCGESTVVWAYSLIEGKIRSCGCLRRETSIQIGSTSMLRHGFYNTRIYHIWEGMKRRCNSPKAIGFKNYGGRGINYCSEWKEPEAFIEWAMENGYRNGLTLDRWPDNNGNYEPGNCRWVPTRVQARNKRNNVFLEVNGERKTVMDWAEELGVKYHVIRTRMLLGWEPERIVNTPVVPRYRT
jgi:hypothetical protein